MVSEDTVTGSLAPAAFIRDMSLPFIVIERRFSYPVHISKQSSSSSSLPLLYKVIEMRVSKQKPERVR
jgi:hypothetical protein